MRDFYGAIWQDCPLVPQSSGFSRCRFNWIRELGDGSYKYIGNKSSTLYGHIRESKVQAKGNGGIKCDQSGTYRDCVSAQTL